MLLFLVLSSSVAFGQATGEYRSNVATGNWNVAGSWQSFNGTIWVAAGAAPTGAEPKITIQGGHNITMPSAGNPTFTISTQLDILATGTLTVVSSPAGATRFILTGLVNNFGTINVTIGGGVANGIVINSGGTISNSGTITSLTPVKVKFNSGSTYNHAFSTTPGTIPTATWDPASTCAITGYTSNSTAPSGLGQNFGHFTWNCTAQAAYIDLAGALITVKGNLNLLSTNFTGITLNGSGSPYTINVTGSLLCSDYFELNSGSANATYNVTGGLTVSDPINFAGYLVTSSGSGLTTLNVTGDLLVDNSSFIDLSFGTVASSSIFLKGNYTAQNSGTVTYGFGSGTYNLTFNGASSTQVFTESTSLDGINITVSTNAVLSIPDGGSGNNFLGTDQSFTVNSNATLEVGSTDASGAIQTGVAAGNIRVSGTRTYNTPCTVVYNGTSAQQIGNGHPGSIGVNTIISNPGGVSISGSVSGVTIGGDLTLASGSGNLAVGGTKSLTTEGTITTNGNFITVTSTSDLIINGGNGANLTGTFPFASGAKTIRNFTLNRTGGSLTFANDVTITGTVTLTDGDLIFNSQSLTMSGTFAASGSGTLFANSSSTYIINGTGAFGEPRFTSNLSGNTIGTFTFNRSSGGTGGVSTTLLIANTFNLSSGTFSNTTGGLQMNNGSTLVRNSTASLTTFAPNDLPAGQYYNVRYTGSSLTTGLELPGTLTDMLGNLTINGGVVTLNKNININGNVDLQSSSFDANGFTITLASTSGTWNKTSGLFVGGSGSLTIDNALHNASYTITATSSPNFSNIKVGSGGTNSLRFPTAITVNISGNIVNDGTISPLTVGSGGVNFTGTTSITGAGSTSFNTVTVTGSLTAPSGTLSVGGNFVNNGTFSHNNGTIAFNGTTAISGSSTTSLYGVSISGTLTAPSGTLNVAGNFANTGVFNNNSGTVLFNGTVSGQSVSGSGTTFNNISVSNPSVVSINSTVRLNGTLTLIGSGAGGGIFDADGAGSGVFIVSSSAQNSGGMIAALPTPANFSGNVTVERFIHSISGGDYRYLAIPITNGDLSMIKSAIGVTGNFSDRSTSSNFSNVIDAGNTNPSVFSYNSSTQSYTSINGAGGLTSAMALDNKVGYSAYDYSNSSQTASFRGTIATGNVTVNISGTTGNFNLVPNPYPAPIDWDNVTKTNVNNAMYLRISNSVFSSYVGGLVTNAPFGGWTGEVAVGQSFFTSSNGSGTSLVFKEADKTSNSYSFLRTGSPENYFRVILSSSAGQQDEAVIRFMVGKGAGFDADVDAFKLRNGNYQSEKVGNKQYLNLASYNSGMSEHFSINTIDVPEGERRIYLSVTDVASGKHSFTFGELSSLLVNYNIVLVDRFRNTEVDVKEGVTYSFDVTNDTMSFGDDRFYLRINGEPAKEISPLDIRVYPNPATDRIQIQLTEDQQKNLTSIQMADVMGNEMINSAKDSSLLKPGIKTVDMTNWSTGVYVVTVRFGNSLTSLRVIRK